MFLFFISINKYKVLAFFFHCEKNPSCALLSCLRIFICTCIMNFLLTSDREKAPLNGSTHICRYCKKVFDSHQALGGHVKSHQNMMQKFPYLHSHHNSTDHTVPYFNPLSNGPGITSSGGFMSNYSASRGKLIKGLVNLVCKVLILN